MTRMSRVSGTDYVDIGYTQINIGINKSCPWTFWAVIVTKITTSIRKSFSLFWIYKGKDKNPFLHVHTILACLGWTGLSYRQHWTALGCTKPQCADLTFGVLWHESTNHQSLSQLVVFKYFLVVFDKRSIGVEWISRQVFTHVLVLNKSSIGVV